jgi:hypothetical protein
MTVRMMACAGTMLVTACGGLQSSLAPAGRDAERIAELFWWMTAVAAVAWLGVIALPSSTRVALAILAACAAIGSSSSAAASSYQR